MKHYELMYIVPVKMGTDDSTEVQDKVRTMLTTLGAKVTNEEPLGKRKLAYPINHVRHGTYVVLEIDLEPNELVKVHDWFRLSPDILRAQIITKQLKTPEQLARERAFQEKLMRKQVAANAESDSRPATDVPKPHIAEAPKTKVQLEELDKKLEEILEQEIVN